jgi:GNAT superfamily N-acetyltransferase
MGFEMMLRQMGASDSRAVKRLLAESLALQQPRGEEPRSVAAIYRRLKDRDLPTTYEGKLRYIVAEKGRKLVGLCVFYTYSDGWVSYADLRDLYVEPSQRRHGVGSALLEAAKKAADEDGCSMFIALPPPDDAGAAQFLEKNGLCPGEHTPYVTFLG